MPYLNLKLSPPPGQEVANRLAVTLTELTATLLGKKPELTSVAVEPLPPERWFLNGSSLSAQGLATFHLDIKVTAGTNTKDEKSRYLGAVFSALESALGRLHPASYVVIHEIPADAWGYDGVTQEFRYIRGKTN